jgi:hypothetical protein
MAIETAVKIDVDVNGIQTVQQAATVYEDLGDAVAKTQREAEALALQFGINDKRTQEAIKTAGQYKQQLEQLDQAVDANRGNTQKLFGAIQGVAAGFEIAAGAMAIFGTTSENLEKILVRVQAAMIFSQGLRDLKEFAPAILNIAQATRAWFVSLSLIQKAFLTLGIGLIIDLVYNLSNAFNEVAEKTNLATKEQQAYNEEIRKLKQERKLLLEGERAVVEENLKSTQARLKAGQQELKRQQEFNAEFFRGQRILNGEIDKDEFERRDKREKAQALENERLLNEQLKLSKRLEELKKQEVKTTTQVAKQGLTDEQKAQIEYEQWLKKERERSAKALEGVQGQQLKNLDLSISEQTQKIIDFNSLREQLDRDYKLKEEQRELDRKLARLNDAENIATSTLSIYGDLYEALSSTQAQESKKYFKAQQNLAIATSIVDTYFAANKAYLSQIIPGDPTSIIRAQIAAGVAIAQGLARIAVIRKQKYEPKSAPSASGSLSNTTSGGGFVSVPTTRLPQSQDILTQERRVYVLEGDITRTQRRAATNQNVSVLGG